MFKQFYDEASSTLTYLIADMESKQAVLIDPVKENIDEYLNIINAHQLTLVYSLETHVHADHITGGGQLKTITTAKTAVSQACGADSADMQLKDNDVITFGHEKITVIATPGHTAGSVSFLWRDRVFTGDSLLINGCGRTDFQSGDAGKLYDCITGKLFMLPDETLVYPGHDYNSRRVSSIGQEKLINPRLANQTRDEFIYTMANLNLPKPKMIDIAVPANRKCGVPEPQQG
ncbi:Zn-dependent hydrolase [Methylotenera oryzisoli]|uniref:Zn-dependent hydrolase n=1 Tax=Methylotenera oryzisoli TaxID=2080758 RepID=A0A4Y9VTE7_9PROT|nr:MBL fold metallo-hydrolase [Methylotenera oryzisoli]TFW71881.1 Zn-dependent hydrolase [Methylotenera oryzisoli]